MGMYPLAAGNLQWQWTFTSFNKQFVPMSFINSWQGQVFFHDTRTEKCQRAGETTYPNESKRMQRDPNGLLQEETNTLFGTHPFVWDAKPKGDLMVSLFTLIFKIFDHKMVEVFLLSMPNHLWVHWDWYPGTPITLLNDAPLWAMSTGPTFEWLSATIMYRLVDATVTPLLEAMHIKGHQTRCW